MSDKILVLEIVNTHALRGDVRALYYADSPDFFNSLKYVTNESGEKLYFEKVRAQKGALLIKFRGVDTPEAAARLRGSKWYVSRDDLTELPEGEYYISDLLGMTLRDRGKAVGTVSDVLSAGSGQILEVKTNAGKKLLIPFVDEFIQEVDLKERVISARLIEGMTDEI